MTSFGVTPRQREALTFISAFIAQHGYSPSTEEIRAALGLKSKSGVHRLVHGLEERGEIRLLPNRTRSIAIVARAA